jgi:hypothetical protein
MGNPFFELGNRKRGLFGSGEVAQKLEPAANRQIGHERPRLAVLGVEVHTLRQMTVDSKPWPSAAVGNVLFVGCIPKVCRPVIEFVSIDMVNLILGPAAIPKTKDKAVK